MNERNPGNATQAEIPPIKCSNCGISHPAAFKGCQEFIKSKDILDLRVLHKLNYADALKKYNLNKISDHPEDRFENPVVISDPVTTSNGVEQIAGVIAPKNPMPLLAGNQHVSNTSTPSRVGFCLKPSLSNVPHTTQFFHVDQEFPPLISKAAGEKAVLNNSENRLILSLVGKLINFISNLLIEFLPSSKILLKLNNFCDDIRDDFGNPNSQ